MLNRLLVAALLCVLVFNTAFAAEKAARPQTGDTPPALLGKGRDGNDINLADYKGKVVILTFWASWCGYCRKELPVLNSLQSKVGDDWLRIIAINVKDDAKEYRAMTRQMRDWKLLLTRDRSGDIATTYGVTGYPDLWIIDPQGKVSAHHSGYGEGSLQDIIEDIQQLLIAEAARQAATQPSAG